MENNHLRILLIEGQEEFTLAGMKKSLSEYGFDVVDVVRSVASSRGVQPAQVALAWLFRNPAITAPIIGATNVRHIEDAVAALDVDLSGEEAALLEAPYLPHAVLGHS